MLPGDVVVRAGAGTGKTHSLTTVVLHALAGTTELREPIPPREITAVTFADAAAAEMRERIRARVLALSSGAGETDRALIAGAARELDLPNPTREDWSRILARLGRMRVSTFHGWALRILRSHPTTAGIDPGVRALDEDGARDLWRQAAEDVILADLEEERLGARELVMRIGFGRREGRQGDLVDLILGLIAKLREEGESPERLTQGGRYDEGKAREGSRGAVEDLRAALGEIDRRIDDATAKKRDRVELMGRLAADDAAWVDDAAIDGSIDEVTRATGGNWGGAKNRLYEPLQRIKSCTEALGDAQAELLALPVVRALRRSCERIIEEATGRKGAAGALDFTDMLLLARDLLRTNDSVRRTEMSASRVLLIDEFQDTNKVQADLVDAVTDRSDPKRRTFLVGDPKQSIYAFRGADVAVYERTVRREIAAGAEEHPLTDSWRSRPSVLRLVNRISAEIFAGTGESGLPDHVTRYDPGRDDLRPVRLAPGRGDRAPVDLVTIPADDVPAALTRARSFRALSHYLRSLLEGEEGVEVRASGDPGLPESSRPPRPGDVAILLRTLSHLELLLRELHLAGVPAGATSGRGFDTSPEIRDLVHYLRFVADPDDAIAFAAALRSPLVGVEDDTLLHLAIQNGDPTRASLEGWRWLHRTEELPAEIARDDARRVRHFLAACRWLRPRIARLGPEATIESILEWTDFEAFHAARPGGDQALANIRKLVEMARGEEMRGGDTESFLRSVSQRLDRPTRTPPAEVEISAEDRVRVMTVHASKGLQFPIVVLADLGHPEAFRPPPFSLDHDAGFGMKVKRHRDDSPRHTPWSRSVEAALKSREEEESKRLLYVALTRARDHLVLSGEGKKKSWRGRIESVRDDLEASGLIRVVHRELDAVRRAASVSLPRGSGTSDEISTAEPRASLTERAPGRAPTPVEITTTGLELLLECPRRYHLEGVLGLTDRPPGGVSEPPSSERVDPRVEGELTHELLEKVDLIEAKRDPATALRSAAAESTSTGLSLESAHSAALRFLRSDAGRQVLASETVEREVDFRLLLPAGENGPAVRVRGRIDLVFRDPGGRWIVVDYKRARARPGGVERHRTQLTLYALAVEALESSRGRATRVDAAVCYLGDDPPTLHRLEPESDFTARAQAAVSDLLRWNERRHWPSVAPERCDQLGCGFRKWCHA